jgi:hypothetical protein
MCDLVDRELLGLEIGAVDTPEIVSLIRPDLQHIAHGTNQFVK